MIGYKKEIEKLVGRLFDRCLEYYGERLVSFVVFGSVAREKYRPDSDIDFLIVAEKLPRGRLKRVFEFTENVEKSLKGHLKALWKEGIYVALSPIFKTVEEVKTGSPLFLDMTLDVKILYDKGNYFENYLQQLKKKLKQLGAKRVVKGNAWYWVLKPDYKCGDIIEL